MPSRDLNSVRISAFHLTTDGPDPLPYLSQTPHLKERPLYVLKTSTHHH